MRHTPSAIALLAASLCTPNAGAAALPPQADGTVRLESGGLAVTLDPAFPRAIRYQCAGATMAGQTAPVSAVELNGKPAACAVAFQQTGKNTAEYRLDFPQAQAQITLRVTVGENAAEWRVAEIRERGEVKIHSFAFPGNAMLSSDAPDAAYAALHVTHRNNDYRPAYRESIEPVAQAKPRADTGNYFFLSSGALAAGIGCDNWHDSERTAYAIAGSPAVITAQNPVWQIREFDDEKPHLPTVRVFVTGDANGDGKADWQDAAVVFRRGMPKPLGHDLVKSTVAENIAMNFASGAQQPFLKILDEIKKGWLATDGIGQSVTIKGFSAEGHDSSNVDYADHWNERAGGLKDLTTLTRSARAWNAQVGFHINAAGTYPEDHRYLPELLARDARGNFRTGWVWLDHCADYDKVKDVRSGSILSMLEKMRAEVPALDFIYLDAYWDSGWPAWKTAMKINELGLPLHTEGASALDPWTTWSHWRGGGGGLPSKIVPFLWFSDRDIAANDPILRGGRGDGDTFMGWQDGHSFPSFIRGTFTLHLPAKYLQHFELLRWEEGKSAQFSGGVKVEKQGDRIIAAQDGREVMEWNGGCGQLRLFVPWEAGGKPGAKIYAWDDVGGEKEWGLPEEWKRKSQVFLYRLSDMGRTQETAIPVADGKVKLSLDKGTPFVLYPEKAPAQTMPEFGEGGPLKDPGFDSHGFGSWKPSDPACARIEEDGGGNPRLLLSGAQAVGVAQTAVGLEGGKPYAFSVWAQAKGKRPVAIEVQPLDADGNPAGKPFMNFAEKTNVPHNAPNDPRAGSHYQRLRVVAQLPAGATRARVTLKAGEAKGPATAEFDDVRVVETAVSPQAAKHTFWEDFEHVETGGYGIFTCCPGERTHLSEANPPHTHDVIDGRFSLKVRDGGSRILRTLPSTLRLKPDTTYKISCRTLGRGRLTAESGGKVVMDLPFKSLPTGSALLKPGEPVPECYTPQPLEGEFSTRHDTESFLGLFRGLGGDNGDFIAIDDIAIDEVGPAPAQAAAVFDDKLPGRAVLMEEPFAAPLNAEWKVTVSKIPGTSVKSGGGELAISAFDNVSALAERALPAGTTAVECRLANDGDQGNAWGPGLCVLWPGGQKIRVYVRIPGRRFSVDSTVAGDVKGGKWEPADSAALRIRMEADRIVAEARNDDKDWQTLATFPRDKFPGDPATVRLGKTHGFETDDFGEIGNDGACSFRRLRIYGK